MRLAFVAAVMWPGLAMAGPILWIDDTSGNIGTVDVQSGAVTVVGPSGVSLTDIAFDPAGNLWGVSFTGLYRLNRDTGAATLVGVTGIPDGNALVFGADGTLYAAGASTTALFTINPATGAGTSIGDIGFRSAGDLAFAGGELYLSSTTHRLIQIDLGPVSGTDVGPFGFNNVFGMATGDGVLYGVAGTRIFSVDTLTGAGTQIVGYAGHGLGGANGTAFTNEAVPEPGGTGLILVALTALVRRRRRR